MSSTITQSTTKITKTITSSSTWDEISNESVGSAGVPLAIEQAGDFFSDQTSETRKGFDKAVKEVVNEMKSTSSDDEFKTYQQQKDKELTGSDRAGSIAEEENKYKIIVDMKGFSAKDLRVTFINENELVVEGEQEKVSPDGAYSKQSFKRRFTLPGQSIIKEATSAFSSDNILTITVPKVTKEVSEKVVRETKALFKKDVKQTEQVQTVVANQQKQEPAQPGVPEVPIVVRGSFFTDSFFESVRKEFQTKVKEIVESRIKKVTTEESVYKNIRDTDKKENAVISVVGDGQDHKIVVDVHGYSQKDLKVMIVAEYELTIQGRVEKKTNNSYCATSFKRSFGLPSYVNIHNTVAALSSEGVLTIVVPKKGQPAPEVASQTTVKTITTKTTTTTIKSNGEETEVTPTDTVVSTDTKVTKKVVTDQQTAPQTDDTQTTKKITTTKTTKIIKKDGVEEVIPIEQEPQPDDTQTTKKITNTKTTKIIKKDGVEEVIPIEQEPQPDDTQATKKITTTKTTKIIKKDGEEEAIPIEQEPQQDDTQITKKITTTKTTKIIKKDGGEEVIPIEQEPQPDDTQTTKKITTTKTTKIIKKDGVEEVIPIEQEPAPQTTVTQVKTHDNETKPKDTSQVDTVNKETTDQTKIIKTTTTKKTSTTTKIQGEGEEPVVDTKESFDTQTDTKVVDATQDSAVDQNITTTDGSTHRTVKKTTKTTITKKTIQQEGEEEEYDDEDVVDEPQNQTKTVVRQEDTSTKKVTTEDRVVPIEVKGKFLQDSTFDSVNQEVQTTVKNTVQNQTVTDTSKQVQQTQEQKTQDTKTTKSSSSQIIEDTVTYKIVIDVFGYVEKEITIKISGDEISIEGKSEIKKGGCTSKKSFKKSFQVPSYVSINEATSAMSSDGMLTLTMPKKQGVDATQTKTEITTAQKNVEQTTNVQQQKVQVTETQKTQEDTTVSNAAQVPIQTKGDFYQDTFFKDTIEIFETALRNTLSRFQDETTTSTTKQDSTFYKALRDKEVSGDSQMEAEGEDSQFHKIVIDVKGYKSTDLKLRIVEDNGLTVEGRVEDRSGGKMSSKSFKKSFWLTDEFCMKSSTAGLSSDGVLSIKVPRTA